MTLHIMTSSSTTSLDTLAGEFAAWLHFEREFITEDSSLVATLIKRGCRYLFVTGQNTENVHELIDDISAAETRDLVLTLTEDRIDNESAFDFLTAKCEKGFPAFHLVCVLADSDDAQLGKLSSIIKAIANVIPEISTMNH